MQLKQNVSEVLSFRAFLEESLLDNDLSVLLIGEKHGISPSFHALLANVDLFLHAERKVLFATEYLSQGINQTLTATHYSSNHGDQLNSLSVLANIDLEFYQFCMLIFEQGIPIFGTENSLSNPFLGMKHNSTTFEQMQKYAQHPDRITLPNQVFADLINSVIEPGGLLIFIGGAAHPLATHKNNQLFDSGMQGRIANARTLYLDYLLDDKILTDYTYHNHDYAISGIYDHYIGTNETNLYRIAFANSKDKKELLFLLLDSLLKAYLEHPKKLQLAAKENYELIIQTFKKYIFMTTSIILELKALPKLINNVIEQRKVKKFSHQFSLFKTPTYTCSKLATAIEKDFTKNGLAIEYIQKLTL